MRIQLPLAVCVIGLGLLVVDTARAQRRNTDDTQYDAPTRGNDISETSEGERDPNPVPPSPDLPVDGGVIKQAGTGGDVAYAEAGVMELGGAGLLTIGDDLTIVALRPFLGYFIVDNVEITGILDFGYSKVGDADSTNYGIAIEPSIHLPITTRVLGFAGLGFGVAGNDDDFGVALRPRLGLDMLVGRSGIFRPAVEFTWATADVVTQGGQTLLGIDTTFGASFGYSVMW